MDKVNFAMATYATERRLSPATQFFPLHVFPFIQHIFVSMAAQDEEEFFLSQL